MKLILSRKGFDSSSGGVPSPILPDGRLVSLPIPDQQSVIRYGDLGGDNDAVGRMVTELTRGKITANCGAHLDPDLIAGHLPREREWRPSLGQLGAAQGHLRNQGVAAGDLFVFFGLFREVVVEQGRFRWLPGSVPRHLIWGWLQVSEVLPVTESLAEQLPWLASHPHLQRVGEANNVIYLAAKALSGVADQARLPGAGVFHRYTLSRQLTAPGATSPSQWVLPKGFYPGRGKTPLSFHADPARWRRRRDRLELQAVARGQEFALDTGQYPDVIPWLEQLLAEA